MNEIMKIDSVQTYNDYFGVDTRHPLVSVVDGREAKPLRFGRKLYGIYTILLKDAMSISTPANLPRKDCQPYNIAQIGFTSPLTI